MSKNITIDSSIPIDINSLLTDYDKLPISIKFTGHFIDALEKRVFDLNVIGKAAILAVTLRPGETREIFCSEQHKATVELKRVSKNVALLLTGWKGLRRSQKNNNNTKRVPQWKKQ